MRAALVLCLLATLAQVKGQAWNALQASFPWRSTMPRTMSDAVSEGWTLQQACSASSSVRGNIYVDEKKDDSMRLIFDVNGFIAGVQAKVPKVASRNFPSPKWASLFIKAAQPDMFTITAYFVNPARICNGGRTAEEFAKDGTGTALYIQNGPDPEKNLLSIPLTEDAVGKTSWTKGHCFIGMGQHYWFNVSEDMSCDEFFPMCLLYTEGKLNAFCWAFDADLTSKSGRYEYPPALTFGLFMKPVPTCLSEQGKLSTMHVYMSDQLNGCPFKWPWERK